MIKPLFSYFLKRVYMNMLKTMIATAIVATSASAMATEVQVAPATVVTKTTQTVAKEAAAPVQVKVETAQVRDTPLEFIGERDVWFVGEGRGGGIGYIAFEITFSF